MRFAAGTICRREYEGTETDGSDEPDNLSAARRLSADTAAEAVAGRDRQHGHRGLARTTDGQKVTARQLTALSDLLSECEYICTWIGSGHVERRLRPRVEEVREEFELFQEAKNETDP